MLLSAWLTTFLAAVASATRLHPRTGSDPHWYCMQSPSNNNHSVWVATLGPNKTEIGCLGTTHSSCLWFSDPHCCIPQFSPEGNIGRMCPSCPSCTAHSGWCKEAEVMFATNPSPTRSCHHHHTHTVTETVTETLCPTPTA